MQGPGDCGAGSASQRSGRCLDTDPAQSRLRLLPSAFCPHCVLPLALELHVRARFLAMPELLHECVLTKDSVIDRLLRASAGLGLWSAIMSWRKKRGVSPSS